METLLTTVGAIRYLTFFWVYVIVFYLVFDCTLLYFLLLIFRGAFIYTGRGHREIR